jgi:hypothetical protein
MKPIYKPELFKKIRKQHLKETAQKRGITMPRDIEMVLDEKGVVTMTMTRAGVVGNMQSNSSCFEGWSLALKRWIPECTGVLLHWQDPEPMTENESGHYQRFLFRVISFKENVRWFEVSKPCIAQLDSSILKTDLPLVLNEPTAPRRKEIPAGDLKELTENQLELRIVSDGKMCSELCTLTNATEIDNQLPVGLFKHSVTKANLVFTGGKSAVDIWGMNSKTQIAKLFELKKAGAIPIGIITELLFYSFILRLAQVGRVSLNHELKDTNSIEGYLIAPDFHPLIDSQLVALLNEEFKIHGVTISIGMIGIEPSFKLTRLV